MSLKISKIVGASNSRAWSQVHEFLPETINNQGSEPTSFETHGHLMAALSFEAKKEGIEVSSFGTEIIKRLQELYYSNESEGVLKKLSQVMESLAAEFLIEVDLEMALMVVLEVSGEKVLYAGRSGGGQVFLRRDSQLVGLLSGDEKDLKVVSGKLKHGDSLVAGTSQFFEIVPQGNLNSAFENESVEKAVESLAPVVHGHEENSQAAAVMALHSQGKPIEDSEDLVEVTDKTIKKRDLLLKLRETISGLFRKLQSKTVRVRDRDPKKQKNATSIALVLVLVFGVSLIMAGRKRQITKQEERVAQVMEEASYKYDEALGLIELNPLRAKSLLKEAQETINLFESETEDGLSSELSGLVVKIDEALAGVSREYELESASEWFDFSLVKDGFRATDFEAEESKILVWDSNLKSVVEINLSTKSSKIVAGGDKIVGGSLVGLAGERGFVVSGDNVTVVDTEKEEVVAEVAGDEWGDIKDAVGFSSNLYLLDGTSDGQILKYLGVSSGLSAKRSYLTGDSYDLSEAISMAIDGSVWVLFKDGTIVKYVRGVKDAFVVAGLDKGLEEPIKIFTSPEVENLYILDRKSMRVVVIAKNGEYQAQYVWPGIAGVYDLVVSEDLGKIYLLTKEKIFTIELK